MKMKKIDEISYDSGLSIGESEINLESMEEICSLQDWKQKVKSRVKETCTIGLLRRRFPIVNWLPNYNMKFAVNDAIAGITVGLTSIPQSIAYAALAGLPLQVNLFLLYSTSDFTTASVIIPTSR